MDLATSVSGMFVDVVKYISQQYGINGLVGFLFGVIVCFFYFTFLSKFWKLLFKFVIGAAIILVAIQLFYPGFLESLIPSLNSQEVEISNIGFNVTNTTWIQLP